MCRDWERQRWERKAVTWTGADDDLTCMRCSIICFGCSNPCTGYSKPHIFLWKAIVCFPPDLYRFIWPQKRSNLPSYLRLPAIQKSMTIITFQVPMEYCLESISQDSTSFIHCPRHSQLPKLLAFWHQIILLIYARPSRVELGDPNSSSRRPPDLDEAFLAHGGWSLFIYNASLFWWDIFPLWRLVAYPNFPSLPSLRSSL